MNITSRRVGTASKIVLFGDLIRFFNQHDGHISLLACATGARPLNPWFLGEFAPFN
jgi:hypothetical protein